MKFFAICRAALACAAASCFSIFSISAQTDYPPRWQQRAEYAMEIDFDVETHRFDGNQRLVYFNNSPDTLRRVFYHLFFNAFQPGSMMDVRSRVIEDPDPRVRSRILALDENEQGYCRVKSLKQDGKKTRYETEGTILVVELAEPILPGGKTVFEMTFESQVPAQIRRSGRDNKEGIDYSMTQWYPKLCEYDYDGWHANPYIGREFHGVWGDFDVKITIDSGYVLAATGYLQNPQEIGHGYEESGTAVERPEGGKLTWHFNAPNVHDFAWAADPDYRHDRMQVPGGPELHFFYQTDTLADNWAALQPYAVKMFEIASKRFGQYPYKQYSVVQGGDGGMEYPMLTLITGHGSFGGLVSVTVHEAMHSWYQGVLATNESLFPWMDEGFTSYAQDLILDELFDMNRDNPIIRRYLSYYSVVEAGLEEPLATHADHYQTNRAYGSASYGKGAVFAHQLGYVVGEDALARGLKRYFAEWKFKHPTAQDFKRVMEQTTGLELDWYFEHWVGTTNTIDYAIKDVNDAKGGVTVVLERVGAMPMPVDVVVTYKKGNQVRYTIPLRIMRGEKAEAFAGGKTETAPDWPWVYPYYELKLKGRLEGIEKIEIDPSGRLADVNPENDVYPFQQAVTAGSGE